MPARLAPSCTLTIKNKSSITASRSLIDSNTLAQHRAIFEFMADANPFQDPLRFERHVPPCAIVIFGANGDLTKRKLLPALYRLAYERRIPPGFAILGSSRTAMSDDDFRAKMRESVQ